MRESMAAVIRLLIAWTVAVAAATGGLAELTPVRLRCEYRDNPEGIGETHPRLGWILAGEANVRDQHQTAYQVLVASSPAKLQPGSADFWDSGKVPSDRMQQIVYSGRPLAARDECWWRVRVWDQTGAPGAWSTPGHWSIGLLAPSDWRARWIGLDARRPTDGSALTPDAQRRLSRQAWIYADAPPSKTVPLTAGFRGTFAAPAGRSIRRAFLAGAVDQTGIVFLNGHRIGPISRWRQIAPIDLSAGLVPGANTLQLQVTQWDGYPPAALGEIELQLDDGSSAVVPIDTHIGPSISPPGKRTPWDGPPETFTYWLPPAPYFRKGFVVRGPVSRATVYATALGLFELRLNGAKVGRDYFTPGWTDFHRRVQYRTYDVTRELRAGQNALGAILGDGWYASVLGYTGRRYYYGGYPRLLVQLEIDYADGTRQVVATDGSWRASFGPIRHADIMAGCAYDARLAMPGWSKPGFDDSRWSLASVGLRPVDPARPLPLFAVEAANADPTRISDRVPARKLTEPRPGAWTFDFGQNLVGWVRLRVRGQRGDRILVRHGEMLNPSGTLYTSNLRGANAVDEYWLRGGEETLEPHFTFHGFRYIEVTGLRSRPAVADATGMVVHSAMDRTGEFSCSNPLVNRLLSNIVWSQKGNYLEVPTDCPQRDERAGWTGDAEFFIRAGSYNFAIGGFFTRWLETLVRDTQLPSGAFGNVAPLFGRPWTSSGWSDSALVCTYTLYRVYDDTRIVGRNFPAMRRYMDWLAGQTTPDGVVHLRGRSIGDHLNLDGGAPPVEIDTAYAAYLAGCMSKMAAAIGRGDEAHRYEVLAAKERAAFQRAFVAPDGTIRNSHQVGYALALDWNLLTPDVRTGAANAFVAQIAGRDWHLGTGFVGTPRLLPALHAAGRDDVAYRLLLQETYPSWLFPVKEGATTMWERWDGWTPERGFQSISMNSFNHYSFGSVAEYLYGYIAGIEPDAPGFRTFFVRPAVEPGLTWARASYDSVSGRIESAWRREGDRLELRVTVPPNTSATISVPSVHGAEVHHVGSGRYVFASTVAEAGPN